MSMPLHPPYFNPNPEGPAPNPEPLVPAVGGPEKEPVFDALKQKLGRFVLRVTGPVIDQFVVTSHQLIDTSIAEAGTPGRMLGEGLHTAVEATANAGNRLLNKRTGSRVARMDATIPRLEDKNSTDEDGKRVYKSGAVNNLGKRKVAPEAAPYNALQGWNSHVKARELRSIPGPDDKPRLSAFEKRAKSVNPTTTLQHMAQLRAGRRQGKAADRAAERNRILEHYGSVVQGDLDSIHDQIASRRMGREEAKSFRKASAYYHSRSGQVTRIDRRLQKSADGSDLAGRVIDRRINKRNEKIEKLETKIPKLEDRIASRTAKRAGRLANRTERREDRANARATRRADRAVTRQATRKYVADQKLRRKAATQKTQPTPGV